MFLLLADQPDVLYGGSAGSGKSDAALMSAAQYVHVPGYGALLLRENFPDLNQQGALIPRSKEWWSGTDARWNERDKRWTFPSGATVTFGYLDSDNAVYQYQGAEFQYIGIDELTQHTEFRQSYLFSRLRRPKDGPLSRVPLRMRGFTNPGGRGHQFVYDKYVNPRTRDLHPTARFVPASLADNPSLDAEEYRKSLAHLDPLTRAQLLAGDWDAVAGGRIHVAWYNHYRRESHSPDFLTLRRDGQEVERCRWADCVCFQTCDPAASTSNAADYFVLSTWRVTPRANVLWWGCERGKWELPEQVELCERSYRRHRPKFVAIEEVMNQRGLAQLLRRSKNPVMNVRGVSPLGRDKLSRAAGFINLVYDGRVYLPEDNPAFPLDDVVGETTRFTGDEKQDANDDIVDCCPEGTMIRTQDGPKPIESVRVGDLVLTHMGRYRPVTALMDRVAEKAYRVRVTGRPGLTVTGNHRVLCHRARRPKWRTGGLEWTPEAEWLSVQSGLAAKTHGLATAWNRETIDVERIDMLPFAPPSTREQNGNLVPMSHGGSRVNPRGNAIPRFVPVTEQFCRILGYFAAEGSCSRHQVTFASSVGEVDLHAMVGEWAATLGLKASARVNGGGTQLSIGSVPLRNWFRSHFLARDEKRLPSWVETLPQIKQWAVLLGYLAGDGHFAADGARCSTISRHLATQLREISCRLCMPVTMRPHAKRVGRVQWHLQWSACNSEVIASRTPEWMVRGKQYRWNGVGVATMDQTKVRFVDGRLVGRITAIEEVPGPVKVYNLAVAEDESYLAEETVVHNCGSYMAELLPMLGGSGGGGVPGVWTPSGR